MPNYVKTSPPQHTIYSHRDLSQVFSPLNNSSVDEPPTRTKKKRSEKILFPPALEDNLNKLSKKRRAKKESSEDVSFGVFNTMNRLDK